MSSNANFHEPAVLTSWKEIAGYLGKGVRTVQRWEKEDGLPIRRLTGTSKIVVKRDELDEWLNSQSAQNGGAQRRKVESKDLLRQVSASQQLRKQHEELRASVNSAMQQLMDECRRMASLCTATSVSNRATSHAVPEPSRPRS